MFKRTRGVSTTDIASKLLKMSEDSQEEQTSSLEEDKNNSDNTK